MSHPLSLIHNRPSGASLVLGLGLVAVVPALLPLFAELPAGTRLLYSELLFWLLALALLAVVRLGEKESWSSLGFGAWRASTLAWGLLAGVLMFLAFPLMQLALKALGLNPSQTQGLDLRQYPVGAVLALALRAGFVEELVFRGYLLERLSFLSGRLWVGVLLSLAAFMAAHLKSWSLGHLLYVAVGGGLLTGLYVWRRDLLCNIIAHVFTDAVGLLALRLAPQ